MSQTIEFNQGTFEIPTGDVAMTNPPSFTPKDSRRATSSVEVSEFPRTTTNLYSRKQKIKEIKNSWIKLSEKDFMNALEYLLRPNKKGIKRERLEKCFMSCG